MICSQYHNIIAKNAVGDQATRPLKRCTVADFTKNNHCLRHKKNRNIGLQAAENPSTFVMQVQTNYAPI